MPPSGYVPKLVVVPTVPGDPLEPYEAPAGLGASTSARPTPQFGLADFALLVLGAATLVWALVAGLPVLVLVLASIVTLVGFLLPVRKLFGGEPAREPRSITTGAEPVLLLDLADPTSMRLAGAYRSLVTAATLHGDDEAAATAIAAGHRALCEAAELLGGRPPANLAELDEVDRSSQAMEQAAATLRRH